MHYYLATLFSIPLLAASQLTLEIRGQLIHLARSLMQQMGAQLQAVLAAHADQASVAAFMAVVQSP